MGPSVWNKFSNHLKILNTTTSFTHKSRKLVSKKLDWVKHNFNHNFYHYHHYQFAFEKVVGAFWNISLNDLFKEEIFLQEMFLESVTRIW